MNKDNYLDCYNIPKQWVLTPQYTQSQETYNCRLISKNNYPPIQYIQQYQQAILLDQNSIIASVVISALVLLFAITYIAVLVLQ